ncbi:MAG: response regulator [Candidatus Latescibacterota bacterium]
MEGVHGVNGVGGWGRWPRWAERLLAFGGAVLSARSLRGWARPTGAALRESEERYRGLCETAPDAIVVHRDGRFLEANGAALRLVGAATFAELARHTVLDFFPPEDQPFARERLQAAQTGNRLPVREARLLRLDGGERTVEFHTAPVRFHGAPAVQTIIRDVTERRQAQDALRALNDALESQVARRTVMLEQRTRQLQRLALEVSRAEERERQRVAAILHEDVQQEIAAALCGLDLLRQTNGSAVHAEAVDRLAARLGAAMEKCHQISHDLSPSVLHLHELPDLLRWLAEQVQARYGLRVRLDVPEGVCRPPEALAVFLFRAVQEMLANVVKHAGVRQATVRVRQRGPWLCLSVRDAGCGFDPQEIHRTAGLGLLGIHERVGLLGGRLRIRSSRGRGSAVSIVIPQDRTHAADGAAGPPDRAMATSAEDPSPPRLRVLLVDDHQTARESLALLLDADPGIEVVGQAADGREAVSLATQLRPDVVVMDVSMPVMSGPEAARQIHGCLPRTRILGYSIHDDPATIRALYQAGAEGYVLKTAPARQVLAAIRGRRPVPAP